MYIRLKELMWRCYDRRLDGIHFDKEQYGELVLNECIEVLLSLDKKTNDQHNYYRYAVNEIKDHFNKELNDERYD